MNRERAGRCFALSVQLTSALTNADERWKLRDVMLAALDGEKGEYGSPAWLLSSAILQVAMELSRGDARFYSPHFLNALRWFFNGTSVSEDAVDAATRMIRRVSALLLEESKEGMRNGHVS